MLGEFSSRASLCSVALCSLSSKIPQRCTPVIASSRGKARCLQLARDNGKPLAVFDRAYSTGIRALSTSPLQSSASKPPVFCNHHSAKVLNPRVSLGQLLISCERRWVSDSAASHQQRKAVVEKRTSDDGKQVTMGKKVAQASKDVSYAGIIIIGIGVTGIMFYTVGKELFSSHSPNGVYTNALKVCKNNVEIQDCLGTPIKGYGEMTRRKRRRHVSHLEYSQDGVNFMRMKFYLEGPDGKGTVHLEMKENERGRYEYRYMFVELDRYQGRTIVLEDNR